MQSVPLFGFDSCFVELLERCRMCVTIKGNQFQEKQFHSYFACVCSHSLCSRTSLFNVILFASDLLISLFRLQHMNNKSVLENAWKTVITVGCVSMAAMVTISRCVECIPFINCCGFRHYLLELWTVPLSQTVNRYVNHFYQLTKCT